MNPRFHVLNLKDVPIYEQLQIEEALLRTDDRNWLLLNHGTQDAIVMGISGKPHELIASNVYSNKPVPVIRRFSGGGCVFVDPNTLFITFIGNPSLVPQQKYTPETILRWGEERLSPLFSSEFKLQENDFTLASHKFGGNALYLRKNRWLLHTSMLWDYSPESMAYLKMPLKAPQYRLGRDHTSFLCTLKSHFASPNAFFEQLLSSLPFAQKQIMQDAITSQIQLPHRRSTTLISNIFENQPVTPHCPPCNESSAPV